MLHRGSRGVTCIPSQRWMEQKWKNCMMEIGARPTNGDSFQLVALKSEAPAEIASDSLLIAEAITSILAGTYLPSSFNLICKRLRQDGPVLPSPCCQLRDSCLTSETSVTVICSPLCGSGRNATFHPLTECVMCQSVTHTHTELDGHLHLYNFPFWLKNLF